MNAFAQNLVVILIVSACLVYIGWQAVQAFRGRKSKLGSCCSKGCELNQPANSAAPKPAPVQFMPLGNVGRSARRP